MVLLVLWCFVLNSHRRSRDPKLLRCPHIAGSSRSCFRSNKCAVHSLTRMDPAFQRTTVELPSQRRVISYTPSATFRGATPTHPLQRIQICAVADCLLYGPRIRAASPPQNPSTFHFPLGTLGSSRPNIGGHRNWFCRKAMLPFGSHQAPLHKGLRQKPAKGYPQSGV